MASKQTLIDEIVRPVVEGLGYECWGVDFVSQGKHSMLRIYIESAVTDELESEAPEAVELDENDQLTEEGSARESGIGLQDCEKVSRQLSAVLDVEDPISSVYTLEVSSPGMDRPMYALSHYERFKGHQVALRLRMPFEGKRKFQGTIGGVEGNDVIVVVGEEEYLFPIEGIEKANIVPQFD